MEDNTNVTIDENENIHIKYSKEGTAPKRVRITVLLQDLENPDTGTEGRLVVEDAYWSNAFAALERELSKWTRVMPMSKKWTAWDEK